MWHTFPPSRLLMIMYKSVDGWPDGSLYSLLLWQLMHSLPKRLLWNISDSIWDYLTASVCVAMKQRLIHLPRQAETFSSLGISSEKRNNYVLQNSLFLPQLIMVPLVSRFAFCVWRHYAQWVMSDPQRCRRELLHNKGQQNAKNQFDFGSEVGGSQPKISGAFLKQGEHHSNEEIVGSGSSKLWITRLCKLVSLWACSWLKIKPESLDSHTKPQLLDSTGALPKAFMSPHLGHLLILH